MQVDCAGASLLMTGSPHTSMPYAMHHFKPRPLAGVFFMFRMNVISHMDKERPHSGREGGLGHVRRDCVSFDGTSSAVPQAD